MEALILLLILLVACMSNIACFIIGAKVGQTVSKGETIETPSLNPLEAYRRREDRKEAEAELDRLATIMENIETYDGTGYGQKDVPRG